MNIPGHRFQLVVHILRHGGFKRLVRCLHAAEVHQVGGVCRVHFTGAALSQRDFAGGCGGTVLPDKGAVCAGHTFQVVLQTVNPSTERALGCRGSLSLGRDKAPELIFYTGRPAGLRGDLAIQHTLCGGRPAHLGCDLLLQVVFLLGSSGRLRLDLLIQGFLGCLGTSLFRVDVLLELAVGFFSGSLFRLVRFLPVFDFLVDPLAQGFLRRLGTVLLCVNVLLKLPVRFLPLAGLLLQGFLPLPGKVGHAAGNLLHFPEEPVQVDFVEIAIGESVPKCHLNTSLLYQ